MPASIHRTRENFVSSIKPMKPAPYARPFRRMSLGLTKAHDWNGYYRAYRKARGESLKKEHREYMRQWRAKRKHLAPVSP